MVDVKSSREKARVYTRRSRTPSPKDSVPKANHPSVISHERQCDDVPSSHEAQRKLGDSKNIEEHPNTEGELYIAEEKVEKVIQSPFIAYVDSLVRTEEIKSPPKAEAEKVPSPEK